MTLTLLRRIRLLLILLDMAEDRTLQNNCIGWGIKHHILKHCHILVSRLHGWRLSRTGLLPCGSHCPFDRLESRFKSDLCFSNSYCAVHCLLACWEIHTMLDGFVWNVMFQDTRSRVTRLAVSVLLAE